MGGVTRALPVALPALLEPEGCSKAILSFAQLSAWCFRWLSDAVGTEVESRDLLVLQSTIKLLSKVHVS